MNMNKIDKVLHDQFCEYGLNAKEWMHKCVLMLPQIERRRIWEKKGFGSIYEYAAKLSGMSRFKVTDSLRVLRKIKDKPEIMKVAEKKGVGAVRPVATIVSTETDGFWADKSRKMTQNTLRTFVRDFKNESGVNPGSPTDNALNKPSSEKNQLSMKLDSDVIRVLSMLKGEGDWNKLMRKLLDMEKPKIVKTVSRNIPVSIRKYLLIRSQGFCEHPNCSKKADHFHHVEPFSLSREHNSDKILYICKAHHKIIHLGYIDESESWQQIEELPDYDIKNWVNERIATF